MAWRPSMGMPNDPGNATTTGGSTPTVWRADIGPTFTDSGATYLRAGTLVSPASTYPIAAAKDYFKAYGLTATLPATLPTNVTGSANNGASIFTIAFGDNTNVYASTNGGQTWSTVAHSLANAAQAVAWGGGNGIAVGNAAAAWAVSSTTTGTSYTVRTGATLAGATANTANAIWQSASSLFVAACQGTTSACQTSPDGTTWTARTLSTALTGRPLMCHGNGVTLIGVNGSATWNRSVNGTTFANTTMPTTAIYAVVGTSTLLYCFSNAGYYTSTDGTTWSSLKSYPFTNISPVNGAPYNYTSDGTNAIISYCGDQSGNLTTNIASTSDGNTWALRWLSASNTSGAGYGWGLSANATKLVAFDTQSPNQKALYTAGWPASPDYVGSGMPVKTGSGSGSFAYAYLYEKVT